MVRVGDWMKVKIGSIYSIGYVSNIVNHALYGEMVEITKVIYIIGGKPQFKKPMLTDHFRAHELESVNDFWSKHQDKSALIDLALLTGDKQWFEELTGQVIQHEPARYTKTQQSFKRLESS